MNNKNEILEFLTKNGLRYLSKFETTESQFKSFLKKKIGLFYEKDLNKIDASNLKNKWFGALARRGFSYETAKKVFEIDNLSEAENIINRTVWKFIIL